MELDRQICYRAARSRDPRFDGRFFIGVLTTGVYCRPICPAPIPKAENVRYFSTAAAAESAGHRPCLRCRPEASPGTPAWTGTAALVGRAMRLIQEGGFRQEALTGLSDRLGITDRHLRRLFRRHLGASPRQVERTQRLRSAKRLIDETELPFTDVALSSGFRSVRRFNAVIRDIYQRSPTQLRRLTRHPVEAAKDGYCFHLAYRPPYDWHSVLGYLRERAVPGVESINQGAYLRTIELDGETGMIKVTHLDNRNELLLHVRFPRPCLLLSIVERVRRMFDLECDPTAIRSHLQSDNLLRRMLRRHPGIRVPGAWDGFELAVRAVVGQQITVRAASTLLGRIAARYGRPYQGSDVTDRTFPNPARLLRAPLERVGLTHARAATVRRLAGASERGAVDLRASGDLVETASALLRVPGIGDWTAQYIAMRACGDPDAFPASDLGLRAGTGIESARALARRADPWRPWRAYAAMLVWLEVDRERCPSPR